MEFSFKIGDSKKEPNNTGLIAKMQEYLKKTKSKKIIQQVYNEQLYRFQNSISLWKQAITDFESKQNPTNEELIRVYNDALLDAHLTALIEVRKGKTLSADFKIIDEKGKEIEDQTDLLNSIWFNQCLSFALDSIFFGYSLIQFGDRIGKEFEKVCIVEREYVYPLKGIVRENPISESGTSYITPPFNAWLLGAGDEKNLGLLAKAVPLTIYKKSALGSWADFSELFGAPLRIGRTNVNDEELRKTMYDMLSEMTSSSFGVFDHEDQVEFIQATKTDAYEVFDKQIDRMNSELSKLILGSTMTTDNGSSRSQSEVHETTTNSLVKSDKMYLEYWVNKKLIPFLNQYHNFNISGYFMFDDTEVVSINEQFERDIKLMQYYKVPTNYITEKYGVPVEELTKPLGGAGVGKSVINLTNFLTNEYDVCCSAGLEPLPSDTYNNYNDLGDSVFLGIYTGEITPYNLPYNLYEWTGETLVKGVNKGLTKAQKEGFGAVKDKNMFLALSENAFQFSGAKTFQQVREMSDFLIDENGNKRSFKDFKEKAGQVFDTYNKNYLRTEYDNAFNGSQMASIWADIEKDKETFPYLQYKTVLDGRVRPEHKIFDGIVLKVDNPFWNTFYPPNGWNCRCTVIKKFEGVESNIEPFKELENPKNFDNNVGKTKLLFTPEHPYYIVEKQYEKLKDNNFNFPVLEETKKKYEGYVGEWSSGTLKGNRLLMQQNFNKITGTEIPDELFYLLEDKEIVHNSKAESTKRGNGAHYNFYQRKIDFEPYSTRFKGNFKYKVVAHEIGHALHFDTGEIRIGETSDRFKELKEVLKDEIKEISKKAGGKAVLGSGGRILHQELKKITSEAWDKSMKGTLEEKQKARDEMELITAVADTLEAITKGAYGWGHGKSYMNKANVGDMEIFAHLTENYFTGNPFFEKFLPNTYKKGNEYLKELLENGRNNQ